MDIQKIIEVGIAGGELATSDPRALRVLAFVKLFDSIYGCYISRRNGRAKELLQYLADNIDEVAFKNESFQDGLIIVMEHYLRERTVIKRQIMRNILHGFSNHYQEQTFQLEKLISVLDRLSVEDIETFSVWQNGAIERWYKEENSQIYGSRTDAQLKQMKLGEQLNIHQLSWIITGVRNAQNEDASLEKLSYLASVGLLRQIGGDSFKISTFGKSFINYLDTGTF